MTGEILEKHIPAGFYDSKETRLTASTVQELIALLSNLPSCLAVSPVEVIVYNVSSANPFVAFEEVE